MRPGVNTREQLWLGNMLIQLELSTVTPALTSAGGKVAAISVAVTVVEVLVTIIVPVEPPAVNIKGEPDIVICATLGATMAMDAPIGDVFVPMIGKAADVTAVPPGAGVNIKLQLCPAGKLAQALESWVTLPDKAVPISIARILTPVTDDRLVMVNVPDESLTVNVKGDPETLRVTGLEIEMAAMIDGVLSPLMGKGVNETSWLPGVKVNTHDCWGGRVLQRLESCTTNPLSAVPLSFAVIFVAVTVVDSLVIVMIPGFPLINRKIFGFATILAWPG